jgi:hypothetical protein
LLSEETASLYASRKGKLSFEIDRIKKQRGLQTETESGLRLDVEPAHRAKAGMFGGV